MVHGGRINLQYGKDFGSEEPLTYDLHEMVPDEDMQEMAQDCENLRKELCELYVCQEVEQSGS